MRDRDRLVPASVPGSSGLADKTPQLARSPFAGNGSLPGDAGCLKFEGGLCRTPLLVCAVLERQMFLRGGLHRAKESPSRIGKKSPSFDSTLPVVPLHYVGVSQHVHVNILRRIGRVHVKDATFVDRMLAHGQRREDEKVSITLWRLKPFAL